MRNLLRKNRTSGFTIIEVMIVLAIAGLIMVIVFIAVPQLQRNQRDNARQNIANRIKAELENYAGNNQGKYPFLTAACTSSNDTAKICDFSNRYISGGKVNVEDPSLGTAVMANPPTAITNGLPTAFSAAAQTAVRNVTKGQFFIIYSARCDGEGIAQSPPSVPASPNSRTFATIIGLDRDGTNYCVDNG